MLKAFGPGVCVLLGLTLGNLVAADTAREYAVEISASAQSSPPRIILNWVEPCGAPASAYTVRRKSPNDTKWGPEIVLHRTARNYEDHSVNVGRAYEYQVTRITPRYRAYGYVYAGIEVPPTEHRGTLLLVVDETVADDLSPDLMQLQQDLTGDGWFVERLNVGRSESVKMVKRAIRQRYKSNPREVKCVFLFGHVPVPYSGNIAPDGHDPAHQGAWPCDGYYGDMEGVWTDARVRETRATDPRNHNVPGDGKFDQSTFPATVKLMVGRVDFANMPGRASLGGPPTFPSEVELLRQYLKKDHAFRTGEMSVPGRGILGDNFGSHDGEAFAASGWRNFASVLGCSKTTALGNHECWLSTLSTDSCLLAYVCGPGTYDSIGVPARTKQRQRVTSFDIVNSDLRAAFVFLYGSWFGDWDAEDSLLRSTLATQTGGLACAWSGRPHWFLHHMSLGEPIGFSARLTQNNPANGLYKSEINTGAGQVHIALMGDPTLRMSVVAPPMNFTFYRSNEQAAVLSWSGLPNLEYHVYKSNRPEGPFERLTPSPLHGTSYIDPLKTASNDIYMVRAIRLEASASGTYYNLSQGAFLDTSIVPPTPLTALAPDKVPRASLLTTSQAKPQQAANRLRQ